MNNPFTTRRWQSNPWKLYLLLAIMWASMWQIIDGNHAYISMGNLTGSFILFVALHLDNRAKRRSAERWAYLPLVWSMSLYLVLALQYDGWMGLVRQENLGVMLTFGIVLGSIHRFIWLSVRPFVVRRQERQQDELITEAQAIVRHYTEGE